VTFLGAWWSAVDRGESQGELFACCVKLQTRVFLCVSVMFFPLYFGGKYHQSSLYWLASLNLWAPRKSHCWLILFSYISTFGQVTMVALYLLWMERHYFNTVAPGNIFVYIGEWWCCIQSKTLIMFKGFVLFSLQIHQLCTKYLRSEQDTRSTVQPKCLLA